MSTSIDGPRNIDTGFRRLDVLAYYQLWAFGAAVIAAAAGWLWRGEGRFIALTGFVPLIVTALIVAALAFFVFVFADQPPPQNASGPTKPAAEAISPSK